MPIFSYRAVGIGLAEMNGTVVADTPRQARDLLRARGLAVHLIEAHASERARKSPQLRRRSDRRLTQLVRELSTLLSAGIPLLQAIDTVAEQHRGRLQMALLLLHDRVAAGSSLADAMREQPRLFDEICVNVTEVGEATGDIEGALERFADFRERSAVFRSRIVTSLLYPCMVMAVGIAVTLFLMSYVVPELLTALTAAGRPLPLATRIVKASSDFLLQWWWMLAVVAMGIAAATTALLATAFGRCAWHRILLRIPLVGDIARKQAIVQLAVVMSTLLKSGVVLVRALQIVRQSTRNIVLRNALERAEAAVFSGRDLTIALKEASALFPPTVIQLLAVGEQSGRLEEMLDRLAADYDRQLTTAAARLTAILEPLLIVVLAVVVGFIAFATVLPILEAGNVL